MYGRQENEMASGNHADSPYQDESDWIFGDGEV